VRESVPGGWRGKTIELARITRRALSDSPTFAPWESVNPPVIAAALRPARRVPSIRSLLQPAWMVKKEAGVVSRPAAPPSPCPSPPSKRLRREKQLRRGTLRAKQADWTGA
jgi:hypothetical protein